MITDQSLADLGWDDAWAALLRPGETAARVLVTHRGAADVWTPDGLLTLRLPDPIAVAGDWVVAAEGAVARVLERRTLLRRRAADGIGDQFLAANVDVCFLATSLNQDFNLRRLLRFAALVADSGAESVVVLTKADLCADPWTRVAQVERMLPGVAVVVTSAEWGLSDELSPWLGRGRTAAFIGTSGVGKSSLVNALIGEKVQDVRSQREDDDRGRHTTTRRELLVLPDERGLVLDTPGIRAVGVDSSAAVRMSFADIEALAERCQFRDCGHASEPGCAVQAAVEEGELDHERLRNWEKLLREAERHEATAWKRRAGQKRFTKMVKHRARVFDE
ncbi:MAG: ribosome small subunit-dependent GTPase A [Proteobacteria bacterium]|nr:ribosome small subunit-dependent GTPase A [Pseudomonadota bacterium]